MEGKGSGLAQDGGGNRFPRRLISVLADEVTGLEVLCIWEVVSARSISTSLKNVNCSSVKLRL